VARRRFGAEALGASWSNAGSIAPGHQQAEAAMSPIAPITDANPTVAEMEARVARFAALRSTDDYVDTGIPGCERTTYRVLGSGPDAALPAEEFHLNIVRCAPGRSAPLHNHLTQEVFIPLSGTWEVFWGPLGERKLRLGPWDTISIPPGVSRGFRNVGAEEAVLIGIAGGRDPGRINWPDHVRAAARAAGIVLPAE
jgi:mannose-6-phosphate isomerase-like protein (cupin superfamily)